MKTKAKISAPPPRLHVGPRLEQRVFGRRRAVGVHVVQIVLRRLELLELGFHAIRGRSHLPEPVHEVIDGRDVLLRRRRVQTA